MLNNNKINTLFMAISKGKVADGQSVEIKRYKGFGTCKVLAVNPNKKQFTELMGYEPKEEPVYTGTREINGKMVKTIKIVFIIRTIPEKSNGVEITQQLVFNLADSPVIGSQKGSWQVIDEYGRSAWGKPDVVKAKGKIVYDSGYVANVTSNYRPARIGEVALTEFIKTYLRIEDPTTYNSNTNSYVMKPVDELSDCECRLDEIGKYFDGNIQEIKDAIELQPNNVVRLLFGVNTYTDNTGNPRDSQWVYTGKIGKSTKSESAIISQFEEDKERGSYANVTTSYKELSADTIEPTDFNSTDVDTEAPTPW